MSVMDFAITDKEKYILFVKRCINAYKSNDCDLDVFVKDLKKLQDYIKNNYNYFDIYMFIEELKDYVNNDGVDLNEKRFIEGYGIKNISDYLFYVILGNEKMMESAKVKAFLESGEKLVVDYCDNLMGYIVDVSCYNDFIEFKKRLINECDIGELSYFFYNFDCYNLSLLSNFSSKTNKRLVDSFCEELKETAKEKVFQVKFENKRKEKVISLSEN